MLSIVIQAILVIVMGVGLTIGIGICLQRIMQDIYSKDKRDK